MPSTRTARILAALGVLIVLAVAVIGGRDLLERRRTVNEIRTLRDQVYRARVSADSCTNELAYQERIFRRFDTVVDSLRGTVRDYERMDQRGVPEEHYDAYLEQFEGYNDSVAVWRARATALRATETACRTFIEGHNVIADSLRGRLEAEGMGASGTVPDADP
jgi:hypothetical protein